jgi:chromosome condensin MukBEF complex kleisin-like MukF subunit
MLKIDTSGEYGAIQASGDVKELANDIITITFSIARGMMQNGDFLSGTLLVFLVSQALTDKEILSDVLISGKLDDAISATSADKEEDEESAKMRAQLNAIQKFTKMRPIKVDGDYNVIKEDDDDAEEERE